MDQPTLSQMVDQQAEISGMAGNAMAGAVVLTADRTPVYIDGLESWDESLSGRTVRVRGLLRHRQLVPEPQVDADGAVSHGLAGRSFVLEGATWSAEP
jgi:hypothetical protein